MSIQLSGSMQVIDLLRGGLSWLRDPRRWAKGHWGYTEDGLRCHPSYDGCDRCCAVGALLKVARDQIPEYRDRLVADAVKELTHCIPPGKSNSLPRFNDFFADHADVVLLYERAIERVIRNAKEEKGACTSSQLVTSSST